MADGTRGPVRTSLVSRDPSRRQYPRAQKRTLRNRARLVVRIAHEGHHAAVEASVVDLRNDLALGLSAVGFDHAEEDFILRVQEEERQPKLVPPLLLGLVAYPQARQEWFPTSLHRTASVTDITRTLVVEHVTPLHFASPLDSQTAGYRERVLAEHEDVHFVLHHQVVVDVEALLSVDQLPDGVGAVVRENKASCLRILPGRLTFFKGPGQAIPDHFTGALLKARHPGLSLEGVANEGLQVVRKILHGLQARLRVCFLEAGEVLLRRGARVSVGQAALGHRTLTFRIGLEVLAHIPRELSRVCVANPKGLTIACEGCSRRSCKERAEHEASSRDVGHHFSLSKICVSPSTDVAGSRAFAATYPETSY